MNVCNVEFTFNGMLIQALVLPPCTEVGYMDWHVEEYRVYDEISGEEIKHLEFNERRQLTLKAVSAYIEECKHAYI